ncbi:hypothetical protein AAG570_013090 [Ranatra chinensis]|uniref:Nucleoporin SEH1 n=1 Tax=Ranatra chinensis TaxID=642074 RepID=A0ABD0YS82_9HEMI
MFSPHTINAEHRDLIHDVAFDHYGCRMATCSSDQCVKVWDKANCGSEWVQTALWKAHSGSVWKVTWAHPEFGQVLATCSFDRTVAVWEEIVSETISIGAAGMRHWVKRTNLVDSRTSVTDVKFAPKTLGLMLATCSIDGIIRIYEAPDVMNLSQWTLQHEVVFKLQCSCISWNPEFSRAQIPMLAVGSDDMSSSASNKIAILFFNEFVRKWVKLDNFSGVSDAVHDIAFAPRLGRSYDLMAVASKDVRIFTLTQIIKKNFRDALGGLRYEVHLAACFDDHNSSVWRVSWNVVGNILASSGDDGCVRMWRGKYL